MAYSVYCSVMISFILLSTSYHPLFPLPPTSTSSSVTPATANLSLSLPLEYLAQPHLPDPSRGWLDLNAGFLLDPVWTGFKHRADVLVLEREEVGGLLRAQHQQQQENRVKEREEEENRLRARSTGRKVLDWVRSTLNPPRAPAAPTSPSPPNRSVHSREPGAKRWDSQRKRLDLRWNGVGCVLDFGFGRGESEVREGLKEEARRAFVRRGET